MKNVDSIKNKCQKDHPEFCEEADASDAESLKKKMASYANYMEETKLARANNPEINRIKDELAVAEGPFKDAEKALKQKLQYIHLTLQD